MCGTCGCASEADIRLFAPDGPTANYPGHDHGHDHDHDHGHDHGHGDAARTIPLGDKVLAKNGQPVEYGQPLFGIRR